jgi:hypothetical protein
MIYYLSTINFKDTTALRRENNALQKVIGQVMPGINQDKKYIQYTAFNHMPNAKQKNLQRFEVLTRLR